MTQFSRLYGRMHDAMGVEGLKIQGAYVKLYRHAETLPENLIQYCPTEETVTSCQALRHASQGHPVLLSLENIGCIAAAISLGLVHQYSDSSLVRPPRLYTNIMSEQSGLDDDEFSPPSPKEFTNGRVYACQHAQKPEYCLFGSEDSGRFKDVDTARAAVEQMAAIQPPVMKNIFFFPHDFGDADLEPDLVVLDVRPVELTKIIQSFQFMTGKRIHASMGALRGVPSDLIAWPYLNQEINVSTYCLGARILAGFEGDRLGIGIPYPQFDLVVSGMEQSKTGYPFHRYPGSSG
jgi:uncharacterized protein (DUF169 family)